MHRVSTYIGALLICMFCSCVYVAASPVVSVTVGTEDPVSYDDFDEGWTYAMSQQIATITLLADITRTNTVYYRPTVADARHTLDLNNHTITENTTDRLLVVDKADAILTVTDKSPEHGGCLYKKQESDANIYTVAVYRGEMEMAGGKLYCENTIDDGDEEHWLPAIALNSSSGFGAVVRVTGGIVEAVAKNTAYAVAGYSTVYISGGLVRATVTKYKNARALSQQIGTAVISGGTLEAYAVGTGICAYTVSAAAWIGTTPESVQNGEVYITGGTFLASTETNNACGARADAVVTQIGSEIVTARGKMHISGGKFTVLAPDPSATQVFAAVSNGTRLFDDATPHHLIGESMAEITISGGEFLVDTRDAEGKYVENGGNIDLIRCWGKLDITGGKFTIYQNQQATGIGCYRNKVTVSGNPLFYIHGATNTRGVVAGPWNHANYCDADASKNMAEIEVNGGTFVVACDSAQGNAIAVWAYGGLSTASLSGDAGYAMQAKVTVNGGEFITIHPTNYSSRSIRQEGVRTGAYGSAVAQTIIHAGKFRPMIGTVLDNQPTGRNVDSSLELACMDGGYYVNVGQLATHINDDCKITRITDAEPEYAEGFRFKVELGPTVAKVTVGSSERFYSSFTRPFNYAQKQASATITLLADIDFIGETLYYNTAPDNTSTVLDLNGHTVLSNGMVNTFMVIEKDNGTFTFKDSGIGGAFSSIVSSSYATLLLVRKGKAIIESGTLFCENTDASVSAVRVEATGVNDASLALTGGKIEARSKANTYALLAKSASTAASLALISNGEIEASSSGNYAFAITASTGGKIAVVNNPKIAATAAIYQAQAIRTEGTGGIDVYGGRFFAAVGRIVYGPSIALRGGFYNELSGETYRKMIEDDCVPPYHTFPTTAAEKATYGDEYVWKVEPLPESGSYVDIIDVDNTNQTLLLNVSDWEVDGWPYTINGTAYPKTSRATDRTMTIPYKGAPGEDFYILVKKTSGDITSHHPYSIPLEITSATALTADKSMPLFIKGAELTVAADLTTKNIYVGPDATLTIHSGATLTADAIFLRTTPSSAAALHLDGDVSGSTKVYYTRIISSKSGYYPFGLPLACPISTVRLSSGVNPDYKAGSGWVLRSYDEQSRATYGPSVEGANWHTIDGTGTITARAGYEMYSGVNYYREFYFPVNIAELTDAVPVTRSPGDPKDAGWNLLVSPLTYPYVNSVEPEGMVISWLQFDGTFVQEIPSSIPPVAVFAYQAPQTGSLSFAGSTMEALMPKRQAPTDEATRIQWIQVDVKNAAGEGDQTSIYSHPTRYEAAYKTGIDVAKLSFEASHAILYSSHAYGEMAFAGVRDAQLEQGVELTVYSPKEQKLTFSLRHNEWLDRLAGVVLLDKKTGTKIDLLNTDYTFDAAAGTIAGRFLLQGRFNTPQGTIDVEPAEGEKDKAKKVIIQDKLYIRMNGQLYDVTGKLVTQK